MNKDIPVLDKYETVIFMATKHRPYKGYEEENIEFKKGSQEEILKDYPMIVYTFSKIIGLDYEHIRLEDINSWMLDILEKIEPKSLKRILLDIQSHRYIDSTGYGTNPMSLNYSPSQAIFMSVYGHLQGVQVCNIVAEVVENLIDMDESLIEKRNEQ